MELYTLHYITKVNLPGRDLSDVVVQQLLLLRRNEIQRQECKTDQGL
jgi:hypothetical protein